LFVNNTYFPRQIAVSVLASCWGLRLSGYLLYRILKIGEDARFDDKRNDFCKFFAFWVFQAVWVFTVSLPIIMVNSRLEDDPLTAADIVGWVLFSIGLIIEAVSDQQKFSFRNNKANAGMFCSVGLWKYSRHPNYFGEIMLWWSLFLACTAGFNHPEMFTSILSPLFITLLLLFVSGIPILEASADKKFGANARYQLYKTSTPVLVPFFPSLFARFPSWFKRAFCCEWGIYNTPRERTADEEEAEE